MSSLRQRPGRALATLISAALGATIVMGFNSMFDTASGKGVDDVSAETLTTAGSVVGGYAGLLVFFSVASTLTVNVRQRAEEIALLRSTGATPGQIKRMVVGEALVVALAGTALAVGPAILGGQALLGQFQDSGQVARGVDFVFGPIAIGSGVGITLLASAGAAFLAVRRAAKAAAGQRPRRQRIRKVAAIAALVAGAGSSGTTLAMEAGSPASMAPPSYGAILVAVGLALLAPEMLKAVLDRLQRRATERYGAGGFLTVHNMRQRADQMSGMLTSLTLFTGMATALLYMQGIESDAIAAAGLTKSVEDKNLETLNYIVVGIVIAFACIMLINSLYAATSYRGREFGQQRLAGATSRQVLGMVGLEGVVLAATGILAGTLAGLAGVLPFSLLRTDSPWPEGQSPVIWLAIVAIAAAATLVTSLATAGRALRTPVVEAVAVAA
nr:ABC transporter permease [Streptomyces coryli]